MKKIDNQLLEILICPVCKGELEYDEQNQELLCHISKLAYPIRNGVPIMLSEEARKLVNSV